MDCVGKVGGRVVIYLFDEEKRKIWEARDFISGLLEKALVTKRRLPHVTGPSLLGDASLSFRFP